MARRYRNRREDASGESVNVEEKADVLAGRVTVELPVSLADIIEGIGGEVEQLAGEAGLRIMQAVMEAELESLAGPKSRHDPEREASRWGRQKGYVVLAGKKVKVRHPRVRDREGQEVRLASYERFQSPPRRQRSIIRQLVHGISTRNYERAIEHFTAGYAISKSAVSREFVKATRGSLQSLCERRIDALGNLAVLMIDGQAYADLCLVVALGVEETGRKHVLGLVQGATENAVVVQHLLDDLVERGLDPTRRRLIVLDGSKALRKAVKRTFGEDCPVQRCQLHKRRNVAEHLPPEYQRSADQRIRTAYAMTRYDQARTQLLKTVAWLEGINPSAARSLREGLEETLTLHRLGLPETLRRSLQSTNLIESALSVARDVTGRVKRWRGGDMRLRWMAAGLLRAESRFRRIRGCKDMPRLLAALQAYDAKIAAQHEAA
jgi:transposase-like protein